MTTTTTTHTPEQLAIFSHLRDSPTNLTIRARAGTGKTTTLIAALPLLKGTTLISAFNRSIAEELKARTASLPFATRAQLNVGTVHAQGFAAYKRGLATMAGHSATRPKVDGGKMNYLLRNQLKRLPQREAEALRPAAAIISRLAAHAKSSGFGLASDYENFASPDDITAWRDLAFHFGIDLEVEDAGVELSTAIFAAKKLLRESNTQLTIIDFDDMIYLPLLLNHPLPLYHNVLIDEAQDLSPLRREFAFRSLRPDGRLLAVGDDRQAIYGFTGASADSLDLITERANADVLPLTICWRCDEEIIREAQKRVPDIRAKADADSGQVSSLDYAKLLQALEGAGSAKAGSGNVAATAAPLPQPGDAIISRLNRPLVAMALALISAGLPARIEGRDICQRLVNHVKSATDQYPFLTCAQLIPLLEEHLHAQISRLVTSKRISAAAMLQDEILAAAILLQRCADEFPESDFDSFSEYANTLFANDIPAADTITLSTIHKAKGREWSRVFILGRRDYMPFHMAKSPWEKQQEENLIYVATTRAMHHLCHINGVAAVLDKQLNNLQKVLVPTEG